MENQHKRSNKMNREALKAVASLSEAFTELYLLWDKHNHIPMLDEHYPHNWPSFDEKYLEATDWLDHTLIDVAYDILKVLADDEIELFEHHGQSVRNAFYDTTMRFEVDPIEYYGWNKIKPIVVAHINLDMGW